MSAQIDLCIPHGVLAIKYGGRGLPVFLDSGHIEHRELED